MASNAPDPGAIAPGAHWRAPLLRLAAVWTGLVLLFAPDWLAMVHQWWQSSTYNHILLVPPIIGWLVAQRRSEALRLTPAGWWPALLPFAGAALLWLLGRFAGLAIARELAVVVMAQAGFAAVMGPEVVAGLLFPLAYMLFLVPFGDELIPLLQTMTARLTMLFLHLAGVPATIGGVFITTPAGYFEVAEACSGIKFLVAMIAYGALVANVCYLRWQRRLAFMAVSVVVPVIANGMRAFGTIWIAGWYGIGFASSFDHVFYGWVFFAVVMALCVGAGWRWFDRPVAAAMIDPAAIIADRRVRALARYQAPADRMVAALGAIALGVLAWSLGASTRDAVVPDRLALPVPAGWSVIDDAGGMAWVPLHGGAARRQRLRLRDAAGDVVDVSFAVYANQGEGRQAGGFGQGAQPLGTRWAWERPGPGFGPGRSDVIQAPGPERRLCLTLYRSGALLTGSDLALRLHVMADHLALHRQTTAVLIVSASDALNRDPETALRAFLAAFGPPQRRIDAALAQ